MNLYVNTPIANEGSLIESRASSTVKFNWYTEVTGGMLKNSTSNSIFDLSHATLRNPGSGLTLQGPFVLNTNNPARLVGEIVNEGSITIFDSANDTRLMIGRDGATNVVMTGGLSSSRRSVRRRQSPAFAGKQARSSTTWRTAA